MKKPLFRKSLAILCALAIILSNSSAFPLASPSSIIHVTADSLLYNKQANTITAQGHAKAQYEQFSITAKQIKYNYKTHMIFAEGGVELTKPNQDRILAKEVSLNQALISGTIYDLQIDTHDNRHFYANKAIRYKKDGKLVTIFQHARYTACQVCWAHKEAPPSWEISSKKIIWNKTKKTLEFQPGHFSFFGTSLFSLPKFTIPDPSVKRKSGFLRPDFLFQTGLGFGMAANYFFNLAPNYDLTLKEAVFSSQGFLTQAQWRHLLSGGQYNIEAAYIHQLSPKNFKPDLIDSTKKKRFFLASKGGFLTRAGKDNAAPWRYGWDIRLQSDRAFAQTYHLAKDNTGFYTSQIYAQQFTPSHYIDVHFYSFAAQDQQLVLPVKEKQPFVLPDWDSFYIVQQPLFGGQLETRQNFRILYRNNTNFEPSAQLSGLNARFTGELLWHRRFINDNGLIFSPLLSMVANSFFIAPHQQARYFIPLQLYPTAGVDVRYPLFISAAHTHHILEPEIQILSTRNEIENKPLSNEQNQSFVFDASNLFSINKFSGADRIEGGTRANIGLHYLGQFDSGYSFYALLGQSFHLAGKNSFASQLLTPQSGLDKASSDYVGFLSAATASGLSLNSSLRLGNKNANLHRFNLELVKNMQAYGANISYTYVDKQLQDYYNQTDHALGLNGYLNLSKKWTLQGGSHYDIAKHKFINFTTGVDYHNDCLHLNLSYTQDRPLFSATYTKTLGFHIALRTLTDFGQNLAL